MKRCPLCNQVEISSRSKACAECHRIRRNARARRDRIAIEMGGRRCYASACPHWRSGNECMYDGKCTSNVKHETRP
jgi:hypothetical protein